MMRPLLTQSTLRSLTSRPSTLIIARSLLSSSSPPQSLLHTTPQCALATTPSHSMRRRDEIVIDDEEEHHEDDDAFHRSHARSSTASLSSPSSSSSPLAPAASSSANVSSSSSSSSLSSSSTSTSTASAATPTLSKQRVSMLSKVLRVVRSPTKGATRSTAGDDYLLDASESTSLNQDLPALLLSNLSAGIRARKAKRTAAGEQRAYGKGGRKSARARVWIQPSLTKGQSQWRRRHDTTVKAVLLSCSGDLYVNGKRYCEYFEELDHRWQVCAPFFFTHTLMHMDMIAIVSGGGKSGQAGAIKNAAAKALQALNRRLYRPLLKKRQSHNMAHSKAVVASDVNGD